MMAGVDHRKFAALVIDLSFTRGGRELYACTSIAGYLGVLTGVRAGAFSLSINFRKPLRGAWTDVPTDDAPSNPNPHPHPNPNPNPYPNPNPNQVPTDAPSNTQGGTSALELPSRCRRLRR